MVGNTCFLCFMFHVNCELVVPSIRPSGHVTQTCVCSRQDSWEGVHVGKERWGGRGHQQACQMAVITATFQKIFVSRIPKFEKPSASGNAGNADALKRCVFHVLKCERASKVEMN